MILRIDVSRFSPNAPYRCFMGWGAGASLFALAGLCLRGSSQSESGLFRQGAAGGCVLLLLFAPAVCEALLLLSMLLCLPCLLCLVCGRAVG